MELKARSKYIKKASLGVVRVMLTRSKLEIRKLVNNEKFVFWV